MWGIMKKNNFKIILLFLLFFFIYVFPYFLIKIDIQFYNSLNKINIPNYVFMIVWTILYSLMSIYIINIRKVISLKDKRLVTYLVINYFANILYVLLFFQFKQLFWSFVMCVLSFISILFVWMETVLFNKKLSYILIPNVLWSLFACVLSSYVFLFN